MRPKSETRARPEQIVKDIRRATRKHHSAEEKVRIVLKGLRGEYSTKLRRRCDSGQSLYRQRRVRCRRQSTPERLRVGLAILPCGDSSKNGITLTTNCTKAESDPLYHADSQTRAESLDGSR